MFRYEVIQSLNNLELSLYEYIMKNNKRKKETNHVRNK